jgi:hypothetical protein
MPQEKIYGERELIRVRIETETAQALRARAKWRKESLNAFLNYALRGYLRNVPEEADLEYGTQAPSKPRTSEAPSERVDDTGVPVRELEADEPEEVEPASPGGGNEAIEQLIADGLVKRGTSLHGD